MDISFTGKTILVTGAGQGIGNELCKRLAKFGAKVIAVSRSPGPLNDLKTDAVGDINIICVDLSNWGATRKALENIGVIDGLVNNAGIAIIKPIHELTEQDFDDIMNINFKAAFNVTQCLMSKIKDGGSIVNVSSLASFIGCPGHSIYSASKAALDALTKSLALELAPRKIRVNNVNPTVILTRMGRDNWSDPAKADPLLEKIPLSRFGEVSEVVDPIVYLLSERSSYINAHCLPVEGGYLGVL